MEYIDRLTNRLQIANRELEVTHAENESLRAEHRRGPVELQRLQVELQRTQAELKRVQAELAEAQNQLDEYEHAGDKVNEQIVEMFSQAQLIAEGMVADVSRDARERIEHARAHEREIVEQAVNAAGKHVHEYARTAQAQMQSIMESFAQEVDQLGLAAASADAHRAMGAAADAAAVGPPAPAPAPNSAGAQPTYHRNGAKVAPGEG